MKGFHNFAVLALISAVFLQTSQAKKILAVEFFGTKSHVITYLPLLEELSSRGHEVTLLSPVLNLAKPGTVREIFTFTVGSVIDDLNMTLFEMKEQNVVVNPLTTITEILPLYCAALYDRPDVQALMEEDFDLVIMQPRWNDCALGLVHNVTERNNAPLIFFTPVSAPGFVVSKTGGHHPHSFVPNQLLGFTDEMNFYQRFLNTLQNIWFDATYYFYYLPVMEKVYRDKLGQDLPSAGEILDKASLTLSNGHFSVSRPKPNLPDVVDVGGIHSRPAKPLSKELEEFVSGSSDGFILFSLGTGLKSSKMAPEKQKMFFNVFSKLKQRVVWKYEEPENATSVPSNVMLMKWTPQQDLLGHKNIRMFITHCGLGGTEEAIFHAVPLLGIPFFGDQPLNALEAENHGFLHKLDWNELTEEILMEGIQEVLNKPIYHENVQKLSNVFRDQIDNPLQRAVWWVEYVLRHNGAPQLRSASRKLNYFQYHSYDVYAIFLLIILAVLYLPFRLLALVWAKIQGRSTKYVKLVNNNGISHKKNK